MNRFFYWTGAIFAFASASVLLVSGLLFGRWMDSAFLERMLPISPLIWINLFGIALVLVSYYTKDDPKNVNASIQKQPK